MRKRAQVLPHVEDRVQRLMAEADESDSRSDRNIGLLDGRRFDDLTVPLGGTLRTGHNLKRIPQGWIVIGCNTPGPGTIYMAGWDRSSFTLGNSGAADVLLDLWLF